MAKSVSLLLTVTYRTMVSHDVSHATISSPITSSLSRVDLRFLLLDLFPAVGIVMTTTMVDSSS